MLVQVWALFSFRAKYGCDDSIAYLHSELKFKSASTKAIKIM